METMQIEVEAGASGQRLDKFVAARLGLSRGAAQKALEGATLNGAPVKGSLSLRGGEVLVLAAPLVEEVPVSPQVLAEDSPLPPILFEDEQIIVINKPRRLVVHAGAGETGATLVDVLRAHGRELSPLNGEERAGIVQRLDKDTTGVMVLAKTEHAHQVLARAFEERRVAKLYRALVCGVPRTPGRIEAPIARHTGNRLKMAVSPMGRAATTLYRVVQSWEKLALCDVDLLTGRTHQIRAHFAYIGHPVAGDELYGGLKRGLENTPNEIVREAMQALEGQALHAARLEFEHPTSEATVRFEAPLPPDFQGVLDALGSAPSTT